MIVTASQSQSRSKRRGKKAKEEGSKGGGVNDLLKLVTNPITNLTRSTLAEITRVFSCSVDNLDGTGLLQVIFLNGIKMGHMHAYLWAY
jgi:hypothetical protein